YKTFTFTLSGAVAGFAGGLFVTQFGFVSPALIGVPLSTEVLIWTALGGREVLLAAFLGALIVRSVESVLSEALGYYWLLALGVHGRDREARRLLPRPASRRTDRRRRRPPERVLLQRGARDVRPDRPLRHPDDSGRSRGLRQGPRRHAGALRAARGAGEPDPRGRRRRRLRPGPVVGGADRPRLPQPRHDHARRAARDAPRPDLDQLLRRAPAHARALLRPRPTHLPGRREEPVGRRDHRHRDAGASGRSLLR